MPDTRTYTRPLAVLAAAATVAGLVACTPAPSPEAAAAGDAASTEVTIYLTRHGETMLNALERAQGWADSPLVEAGEEDAEHLGEGLKAAGIDFEAVYSADMVRHFDTARLALDAAGSELVPIRDERLREVAFGEFEGADNEEMWNYAAKALGYADMGAMFSDYESFEFNDALDAIAAASDDSELTAETAQDVAERAFESLSDIAEAGVEAGGGDILVVSSGITIMSVLGLLGADLSGVTTGIDNAAVSKLVYLDGAWTVESVNDLSYVEAGAQD